MLNTARAEVFGCLLHGRPETVYFALAFAAQLSYLAVNSVTMCPTIHLLANWCELSRKVAVGEQGSSSEWFFSSGAPRHPSLQLGTVLACSYAFTRVLKCTCDFCHTGLALLGSDYS